MGFTATKKDQSQALQAVSTRISGEKKKQLEKIAKVADISLAELLEQMIDHCIGDTANKAGK